MVTGGNYRGASLAAPNEAIRLTRFVRTLAVAPAAVVPNPGDPGEVVLAAVLPSPAHSGRLRGAEVATSDEREPPTAPTDPG